MKTLERIRVPSITEIFEGTPDQRALDRATDLVSARVGSPTIPHGPTWDLYWADVAAEYVRQGGTW